MHLNKIIAFFFTILILQSCTATKNLNSDNSTFWVSGFKTEASAGAGKMKTLQIYRGDDLNTATWENFYTSIEGFTFEEGYLQKIEVKEEKLDRNQVPADASTIKYTLVQVLEKQKDIRVILNGKWTLQRLNDHPISKKYRVPSLEIDLTQNQISGNNSCNDYTGQILSITASKMGLGNIAATQKMCRDMSIADEFNQALNSINTYQIKGDNLIIYNEKGEKILSFMKDERVANQNINDEWIATRINGNPINRMTSTPRMEIDLVKMQVTGNNSCNNYTGKIETATDTEFVFSNIATTKKMCRKMEVADRFNQALRSTASYKLSDETLTFYNAQGEENLSFLKAQ